MTKGLEVLRDISADLKINQYLNEPDNLYFSRLIYSAMGSWILYNVQDKNNIENESICGASKNYITRRCSEVLESFFEIFPQVQEWFLVDNIVDCSSVIKYIKDIYEFSGFLVSAGTDTSLTLPECRSVILEDNLALVRGSANASKMIGIGTYKTPTKQKDDLEVLFKMFLIPNKNAEEFVRDYIKRAKWSLSYKVMDGTQFFDFTARKSFSQSWKDTYIHEGITIYKSNFVDYGLVKSVNEKLHSSQFLQYIIETKEVRRFMYGLKGMNKYNSTAKIFRFKDVATLRLYSALPMKERVLFRMLTWPQKSIKDENNFYVPLELINIVKMLLENLCIDVEVV